MLDWLKFHYYRIRAERAGAHWHAENLQSRKGFRVDLFYGKHKQNSTAAFNASIGAAMRDAFRKMSSNSHCPVTSFPDFPDFGADMYVYPELPAQITVIDPPTEP